jgi:CheY-like chemotaxis protein
VDDDPCIRELHTLVLRSEGYEVETAADGAAALERLAVKIFDLVVTDRAMPNLDGASLVLALRSAGSSIPVVMVSGSLAQAPLPPRVAREVSAALPKPALTGDILSAVAHALRDTPRRESLRHFRRLLECEAEPPAEGHAASALSTTKALMSTEAIAEDATTRDEHAHPTRPLPPIVRIVLTQAARHRMRGQITVWDHAFHHQGRGHGKGVGPIRDRAGWRSRREPLSAGNAVRCARRG